MDAFLYRIIFVMCIREAKQYRRTDLERFAWVALAMSAIGAIRKIERGT